MTSKNNPEKLETVISQIAPIQAVLLTAVVSVGDDRLTEKANIIVSNGVLQNHQNIGMNLE